MLNINQVKGMILDNMQTLNAALLKIVADAAAIGAVLTKAQAEGRQPTDEELKAINLAPAIEQKPATVSKGPVWGNL